MNIAIIDTDSLFYQSSTDTIQDSIQKFDDKFQNILDKTQCDYYVGFYTSGKTFRNDINPEYKANRTQVPPKYMRAVKEYAIAEYNLQSMKHVEADDLVMYWMNQDLYHGKFNNAYEDGFYNYVDKITNDDFKYLKNKIKVRKTLCAIDKDLLNSIPGEHFNYTYKLEDKNNPDSLIKGKWIKTSIDDAIQFIEYQILIGDKTDGIDGVPGIGIKKAQKIFDSSEPKSFLILQEYLKYYKSYPEALYQFQKNYRCLYLLKTNEDFIREVGKIPELPTFTKVKKLNDW